jgi:hypothetical protein
VALYRAVPHRHSQGGKADEAIQQINYPLDCFAAQLRREAPSHPMRAMTIKRSTFRYQQDTISSRLVSIQKPQLTITGNSLQTHRTQGLSFLCDCEAVKGR